MQHTNTEMTHGTCRSSIHGKLFHRLFLFLMLIFGAVTMSSCVNEEEFENNPNGNFEALWKIMDEHYCFFPLKEKELGVNWNEVHERYKRQVSAPLNGDQLFEVLGNMLGELRDGHVNMSSSFDLARNWSWREDYPANLSDTLLRAYLDTDYCQACGMQYRFLDDNIGYIRCSSFGQAIGEGNIDEILFYLAPANGLIIDVRSNGGGMLTSAEALARRFTNREILVGYMQHKTGKGHEDFSAMAEQHLSASNRLRWQKKVVVLTNRGVYSAANEFVKYMKVCGATIVGDRTGGGAGMPFSSELPNGWSVRFSACPMYDIDGNSTEQGIDPDINVSLSDEDFRRGKDSIIEYARKLF